MQTKNYQYMIKKSLHLAQAGDVAATAIHRAVADKLILPSLLKENLEKAGFNIIEDEGEHEKRGYRKFANLTRLLVDDAKGNLVAMGAASDYNEALLAAMLGYCREQPATAEVEARCLA